MLQVPYGVLKRLQFALNEYLFGCVNVLEITTRRCKHPLQKFSWVRLGGKTHLEGLIMGYNNVQGSAGSRDFELINNVV